MCCRVGQASLISVSKVVLSAPSCPGPSKLGLWPQVLPGRHPGAPLTLGDERPVACLPPSGPGGGWAVGRCRPLLLPSRNGISKWSQREAAGPGSLPSRKDPELGPEELGAAVLEPRGGLGGMQRALAPPLLRGPGLATPDTTYLLPARPCPVHASPLAPVPLPLLAGAEALTVGLLQWFMGARPKTGPGRSPLPPSGGWPKPSRRSESWPSTSA